MSSGKPRSWNPNALRIYLQQVNYIMDDIERGADPRSAITAGMTGSVLSYVLRKLKMRPPSRDEYTGAGRMVYRPVSSNPPMYAHHLNEIKTHGLSVKQLRRLYAMVSRGNQKAITYARNVFGIPFDETASQVKAVVKHHLIDVGAGKVRRNPYLSQGGKKVLYGYAKDDIKLLGTGLKISKGELVLLTPATNIPGGGYFARPGYLTGIWKQVSEDDSIYLRPSEIKSDITFRKPVFGSKSFGRMIRGNPGTKFVFVTIHHNYFHWRTDDNRSGGQPFSSNSELKSLLLKLKSLLGLRKDQIEIRDERGKK